MWYLEAFAFLVGESKVRMLLLHIVLAGLIWFALRYLGSSKMTAGLTAYLMVGLLTFAIPMSIFIPATNFWGILYLTIVWLPWIYGKMVDPNLNLLPDALAPYFFTF